MSSFCRKASLVKSQSLFHPRRPFHQNVVQNSPKYIKSAARSISSAVLLPFSLTFSNQVQIPVSRLEPYDQQYYRAQLFSKSVTFWLECSVRVSPIECSLSSTTVMLECRLLSHLLSVLEYPLWLVPVWIHDSRWQTQAKKLCQTQAIIFLPNSGKKTLPNSGQFFLQNSGKKLC